jgi:hypothetical protein
MSISAWPSIDPSMPRSAWTRAVSICDGRSRRRNNTARIAIMTIPPTNSAKGERHPSSSQRITPSSITRFVEANWNAIAEVKSAPFRKSDLANATAA